MRLNHIELFYVFLLCFRSEERGRPATDRPSAGAIGHGQAPAGAADSLAGKGGACEHYAHKSCRLRAAVPVRPLRVAALASRATTRGQDGR
ncbi:hypothetical protein GW17_00051337 [Ensete ventricosum]|nr:hypothetical protein GW17_00051337 [Ensete ventricosum]